MNIVLAPDSFKGSLSAEKAAEIMGEASREIFPEAMIQLKPMADGGEGTVDAIFSGAKGRERIELTVTGPLGSPVKTTYAIVDNHVAVIECANICGLTQVPTEKRNPLHTTTYGLGEVLRDVYDNGIKECMIGLGGSATNDGGLGMLQALGVKAYAENGEYLGPFGGDMLKIDRLDFAGMDSFIKDMTLHIACDVDNPLCGENGATAVYGPQKGLASPDIEIFDRGLFNFSEKVEAVLGGYFKDVSGSGAAGGLGFAFLLLGGKLESGAKLLADIVHLEESVKSANLVITGEGKSDTQTLSGKAPGYVGRLAHKYKRPAFLISGDLGRDIAGLYDYFSLCKKLRQDHMTVDESMEEVRNRLYHVTVDALLEHKCNFSE